MTEPSDDLAQARVTAWLRDEGYVTIPPQVAVRVQEAIAAEARGSTVPVAVDLQRRPSHRGRWLLAASVAAVAALGALTIPSVLDGGSDLLAGGDDSAPSTTGSAEFEPQTAPEAADADGGDAHEERATTGTLPPVPDDLQALLRGTLATALAAPDCGATLAAAVDGTVVTSADVPTGAGGVVVLVQEPGTTAAWWLPSCASGPGEALGRTPGIPSP